MSKIYVHLLFCHHHVFMSNTIDVPSSKMVLSTIKVTVTQIFGWTHLKTQKLSCFRQWRKLNASDEHTHVVCWSGLLSPRKEVQPMHNYKIRVLDEEFFMLMQPGSIFINATRGEVVDEQALMMARTERKYIQPMWLLIVTHFVRIERMHHRRHQREDTWSFLKG